MYKNLKFLGLMYSQYIMNFYRIDENSQKQIENWLGRKTKEYDITYCENFLYRENLNRRQIKTIIEYAREFVREMRNKYWASVDM